MRNKIFQFVWYYIVRPVVPVPSKKKMPHPVIRHSREIYVQVRLAQLFGGIDGVLAGDSNSAVFSTFMVMQRFSGLVVALGQGGSTAADWLDYFVHDKRGRYVQNAMTANGVTTIWNVGGNYILLGITSLADMGMAHLRNIFPRAWFCTIPPLYYGLLAEVSKVSGIEPRDAAYYKSGVDKINRLIRELAKPRVIDLYKMFVMVDGTPIPGALKDMVHFRRIAVNYIRRMLGGII